MKLFNYLAVGFLVLGLIMIRQFQYELFYDPFLAYFNGDYRHATYPDYNLAKLLASLAFRYGLNMLLSVGIIYFLFTNKNYIKYALIIFGITFLVLTPIYIYFIQTEFKLGFAAGFYVRRFLIQPMLLLLLVPAFYYLNYNKEQPNT